MCFVAKQGAVSMHEKMSYRILSLGLSIGLGFAMCASEAKAQRVVGTAPTDVDLYCSGVVTDQPVPRDTYVISGENSAYKDTFHPLDPVFINRGADQGVK